MSTGFTAPQLEELENALLRTGSEPNGLLVNGTKGAEKRMLYPPRILACEIFEAINL